MNLDEEGIWRYITDGLSRNHPIDQKIILNVAIGLGENSGVSKARVKQIFEAILNGIKPGTYPL
ncbi:hypothetical protein ABGV49_12740 [Chromobacterium vaccinii]|uniref:Uncharacterized protein n=1 Tax=Chromobacterium vaccinii TaxID=1108595 RepID=A0ABV0FF96_9NEIS